MEYFGKANEAKEKTNIANVKEQIQMEIANKQVTNDGKITDEELEDILNKYGTVNYEEDKKTIKGITIEGKHEISIKEIYNGKTTIQKQQLATKLITTKNYGDEVNYSSNGVENWKIFLNDGKNVYIIASEYVLNSKLNYIDGIFTEGEYAVYGDTREGLVKWLQDEKTCWKNFAQGINGAIATGGPTLNQFLESYNNLYETNYSDEVINILDTNGYNNILYFPNKEEVKGCQGYFLATVAQDNLEGVECINYAGWISNTKYNSNNVYGVRPLVRLPSSIYAFKDDNNKWTFTN